MKWGRQTDYHGSRSYGADEPLGQLSLLAAWIANMVRGALRKPRKIPSPPTELRAEHEPAFSLFAGARARQERVRPPECPFPVKRETAPDPRDWRVYP